MGILIFPDFSKSGIQYLCQGETSVSKVLVPIKVVPERMTISFIKNSNCINISKSMSFCIGAVFTEKSLAHILVMSSLSGRYNLNSILSIYSKSFLAIKSPTFFFQCYQFKVAQQLESTVWCYWCYWVYFE